MFLHCRSSRLFMRMWKMPWSVGWSSLGVVLRGWTLKSLQAIKVLDHCSPFPAYLVKLICQWSFVDLTFLSPDNLQLQPESCSAAELQKAELQKARQSLWSITDYSNWAFSVYIAVMLKTFPHKTLDLISYKLLHWRLSKDRVGRLDYDVNFHKKLASAIAKLHVLNAIMWIT